MSRALEARIRRLEQGGRDRRKLHDVVLSNRDGPGGPGAFWQEHGRYMTEEEMDVWEADLRASGEVAPHQKVLKIIITLVGPPDGSPAPSRAAEDLPAAPVDLDNRDALRAELARLKAQMAAAQEAEAEREAEKAATPRQVRAFRRVTGADRSPVMNLGKPHPH